MNKYNQIISAAKSYQAYLTKAECWCGVFLRDQPIRGYPHPNGWPVVGREGLWWLFITCPSCGYDWALWKLGVKRI